MTVRTAPAIAERRAQRAAERRAKRALAVDLVIAAVISAAALSVAAGLGVIAFFAIPILLIGLLWIGIERLVSRIGRRRRARAARRLSDLPA